MLRLAATGFVSTILQNTLLTVFFAILARVYSPVEFAHFLTGNSLYQLFAALSTMGLGQWFSREVLHQKGDVSITVRYFKMQLMLGIFFYLISGVAILLLYRDYPLFIICLLCCSSIVIDNWIDAFKNLNIATDKQQKTYSILLIDSVTRCTLSLALFLLPINLIWLCLILLAVRIFTLSLFFKAAGASVNWLLSVLRFDITAANAWQLVSKNFYFAVIGGISVIYWRSGSIVASKILPPIDLAYFEIAFKVFILFQMFPLVFSSIVFPRFVAKRSEGDHAGLFVLYQDTYWIYLVFGLCTYAIVYLLSDTIIPLAFGQSYAYAAHYVKIMLLVILFFPTAFLQANLLVALGKEKDDMIINLATLVVYGGSVAVGFHYLQSLDVVVYSIVISWIFFHLVQDIYLLRKGYAQIKSIVISNLIIAIWVAGLYIAGQRLNKIHVAIFLCVASGALLLKCWNKIKNMVWMK